MQQQEFEKVKYLGRGNFEGAAQDVTCYIYDAIKFFQPVTRPELVEQLAIPRTTIYDSVDKLINAEKQQVRKVRITNKKRGRPKIAYEIVK